VKTRPAKSSIHTPNTLLGGLTPSEFMRHYWQKKPLLVRQALPSLKPPISAAALKKLSRRDDVESRLIWRESGQWQMEAGPFGRLPPREQPDWTLLVQSVDLHDDAAAALLHRFDFVPSARLDDLMISLASAGGGVGPHFDSYDVFLIQAAGKRRWRYGQQEDLCLVPDLPLKILAQFKPSHDEILEAGDLLYLPPQVAHDGVAVGPDCMTMSIGFRAPDMASLAQGMLETAAQELGTHSQAAWHQRFTDPAQPATDQSGEIPERLIQAALKAVRRVPWHSTLAILHLGRWLTEPNPLAVFEPAPHRATLTASALLKLDRRTRMLYRGKRLFINGELAEVPLNMTFKLLADEREVLLTKAQWQRLSQDSRHCLQDWIDAGWVHQHNPA